MVPGQILAWTEIMLSFTFACSIDYRNFHSCQVLYTVPSLSVSGRLWNRYSLPRQLLVYPKWYRLLNNHVLGIYFPSPLLLTDCIPLWSFHWGEATCTIPHALYLVAHTSWFRLSSFATEGKDPHVTGGWCWSRFDGISLGLECSSLQCRSGYRAWLVPVMHIRAMRQIRQLNRETEKYYSSKDLRILGALAQWGRQLWQQKSPNAIRTSSHFIRVSRLPGNVRVLSPCKVWGPCHRFLVPGVSDFPGFVNFILFMLSIRARTYARARAWRRWRITK